MSLQYGKTLLLTTSLGTIDICDRQNPPSEEQVRALAELIKQDGEQRQPILLRPVTPRTYKVVCGATRLRALRLLNWPKVKAQIVSSACWWDYEIAELSDDISHKSLTREQQAESQRKLKELRQKAAAAAGSVEKAKGGHAKGGRGNKGGVRESARQAGIPESTARRHAKQVRQIAQNGAVADQPHIRLVASQGVRVPKKRRTIEDFQADIRAKQSARAPEPTSADAEQVLDRRACLVENSISRALNELGEADQYRLIERLQTFLSAVKAVLHDGGAVELPSRRIAAAADEEAAS